MDNSKKKNLLTTSVYIIASFCFLALIGVGVFASLRAAFTKPQKIQNDLPKTMIDKTPDLPKLPDTPSIPDNNEVFGQDLVPETPITEDLPSDVSEEPTARQVKYVLPMSGNISKEFSKDSLVFSQTMQDYRTHAGMDFPCDYGEPVKCFTEGIVEDFASDPLNGMTLTISHEDGLVTRYCNLAVELPEGVEIGSEVHAGDSIAYVGEPGILECAEGHHLHFEIEKDGRKVGLSDFEISE